MEDRYYVQRLTDSVFVIRKCLSSDGKAGPNDHIVRSFEGRHDAFRYADTLNERQGKLDEDDGYWPKHAS
jgi:hypothetical protein